MEQITCPKQIHKKQLARLNNLNPLIKNEVQKQKSFYLWNQKLIGTNPQTFLEFSPEFLQPSKGPTVPTRYRWSWGVRWATSTVNDCNFQVCHDLLETRKCKKSLSWHRGEKRWTHLLLWLPLQLYCFTSPVRSVNKFLHFNSSLRCQTLLRKFWNPNPWTCF